MLNRGVAVMSKFLIGYIVGDCYGKSIDEDDGHLIYNYSFMGLGFLIQNYKKRW